MRLNITAIAWKVGERRSKCQGIDGVCAIFNCVRDVAGSTRPEPDVDIRIGTLHHVPPAAVLIELGAV